MNKINLFLYFFIYSFMGWCCEVLYCLIKDRKFINRGFLNGTICPIYGLGAIYIIGLLYSFKDRMLIFFLLAVLSTSTLEYLASVILEKLFNTTWWDYSHYKFNINGRVCLLNSTLFGILSLTLVEFIHPYIIQAIYYISYDYKVILTYIIGIIFCIDLIITINGLINFQEKLKLLNTINIDLRNINARIKNKTLTVKENINLIHRKLRKRSYQEKRFIKAFPHMRHKIYNEQLAYFRELLKEKRDKRR